MNKRTVYLDAMAVLTVALLTAGCAEETAMQPEGEPMRFEAATPDGLLTRAAVADTWDGGEEVAVSLNGVVKKYVVSASGTLSPAVATDYFIWPHGTRQTVTAWYPYAAAKPAVEVAADQSATDDYEGSNLMEAEASATYPSTFQLAFRHRTAQLTFVPMDYDGASAVTSGVDVRVTNLGTATTPHANGDGSFSVLVTPQTVAAGTQIAVLTYDGNDFVYKVDAATQLAAGSSYTYNVKFNTDANAAFAVSLNITSFTYNGYVKTPVVTVTCNGRTLTEGTDYTLSGDLSATNAGDYLITATGMGNFKGTGTKAWKINKAAGTFSSISLGTSKLGVDKTTTVSASLTGDGTVTYTSGNNAIATVNGTTVTGVGSGTVTITGTVADGANYTYSTTTRTAQLKVTGVPATLEELKEWVLDGGEYNGSNYNFLGWYVDASGNISTDDASCIGRIAWISTSDVDVNLTDTRILVLATDDAATGNADNTCAWKATASSGESAYNSQNSLNGYAFTTTHNSNATDYPAAYYASQHTPASPTGCSAWFLPSYRQMDNMLTVATSTGTGQLSGQYWLATESSSNTTYAWARWSSRFRSVTKTAEYKVRPCFAY